MLFDAICPACGASQRMSSMYAGTRRRCTSCGASFVLQLPETVRESIEQNRPKPAARTMSYTCQDCLESFVPPVETIGDPHRTSGAVQCRRCGGRCAPSPEVRARLDASEKALLSALLIG